MPTLYVLQQIFSSPPDGSNEKQETHIHLQDYNASVLELVTLPNVILAWCTSITFFLYCNVSYLFSLPDMSTASSIYRSSLPSPSAFENNEHPTSDPTTPSTLPISSELKVAFQASLAEHNIHLRFFSGPWEAFETHLPFRPGWR